MCTLLCPKDLASDQTTARRQIVHQCERRHVFQCQSTDPRREPLEDYGLANPRVRQRSSTRCRMAGASRETALLRWRPRASRRPAAGFHTLYRSAAHLQSSNSPIPGSLATRRVPGPPTQSIASAAGPRRRRRPLREGRRIDRSSASLSRLGSAIRWLTGAESALRHRLPQVPSRCREWAHLAFETWSGRPVTRTHLHSSLAPKDSRRGLSGSPDRHDREVRCLARRLLSYPGPCGTVALRIRTTGCRHPQKHRRRPAQMLWAPGENSAPRIHPARVRNRTPQDRSRCQYTCALFHPTECLVPN